MNGCMHALSTSVILTIAMWPGR